MAYYVAEFGLLAGLDLTYEMTREYAPQYFFDEMKGKTLSLRLVYISK